MSGPVRRASTSRGPTGRRPYPGNAGSTRNCPSSRPSPRVRFLPNPYYVDELRPLTGLDDAVFDYVMASDTAKEFADKLEDMIRFLIPNYIKEGKTSLVIGIGCTGGKHRSVTITNKLAERLKQLPYSVKVEHRDIMR